MYRSFLASPLAGFVPQSTRDALFQLICDLRTNVPKDGRFLARHMNALKPKTPVGWLAVAAVGGCGTSAALMLLTLTLSVSVIGLCIGVVALLGTGIVLAISLGFLAFVMMTSAIVVGVIAWTALAGYTAVSTARSVMRYILSLYTSNVGSFRLEIEERRDSPNGSEQPQVPSSIQPGVTNKLPSLIVGTGDGISQTLNQKTKEENPFVATPKTSEAIAGCSQSISGKASSKDPIPSDPNKEISFVYTTPTTEKGSEGIEAPRDVKYASGGEHGDQGRSLENGFTEKHVQEARITSDSAEDVRQASSTGASFLSRPPVPRLEVQKAIHEGRHTNGACGSGYQTPSSTPRNPKKRKNRGKHNHNNNNKNGNNSHKVPSV
jgi:hypothetical protein